MDTMHTVDTDATLEGPANVYEIGRVTEQTKGPHIAFQEGNEMQPGDLPA
jgi:hypothetical protein